MIYELTSLTAAAGRLKEVSDALAGVAGSIPGELLAAWTTEVGRVNEVLVLRRYEKAGAPAGASEIVPGGGHWLEDILPLCQDVQLENFRLLPALEHPQPGALGAVHELRTYTYRPGMLDELLQSWTDPLLARSRISPAPLVMYSVTGRATRFMHLWIYQSYEQRLAIRAEQVAKGTWPPPGGRARWLAQENALLQPLPFSPMR